MVVEETNASHILLKPVARPVTVRHVLSHTSGLTGSSELQQVSGADSAPLKARALSSVTGPLQWQPGEKYQYGNQGMNIAARIVEMLSGLAYEEFLQKRFFDPLGMTETTFWPSETQVARLAGTYGPNKEKNGVSIGPGPTAVTEMPRGPNSFEDGLPFDRMLAHGCQVFVCSSRQTPGWVMPFPPTVATHDRPGFPNLRGAAKLSDARPIHTIPPDRGQWPNASERQSPPRCVGITPEPWA